MRSFLETLKKQNVRVTINYSNGDMAKGYIKNFDRMGFVYTIGMIDVCSCNTPYFVPWVAIKNITT